jgi:hypothetical protein
MLCIATQQASLTLPISTGPRQPPHRLKQILDQSHQMTRCSRQWRPTTAESLSTNYIHKYWVYQLQLIQCPLHILHVQLNFELWAKPIVYKYVCIIPLTNMYTLFTAECCPLKEGEYSGLKDSRIRCLLDSSTGRYRQYGKLGNPEITFQGRVPGGRMGMEPKFFFIQKLCTISEVLVFF